jgi:hypothetical protein
MAAHWYGHRFGFGFPLLLIIIGLIWLARDYGWIPKEIPLVPWIILGIGVWILIMRVFISIPR